MMIHSTTSGSSSSIRLAAGLMAPKLSMLSPVVEDPEDRSNLPVGVRLSPKSSPTRDEATARQQIMYARFQAWALRNYGELGKTKTVTRSKYNRVKAILKGEEPATADNSKLRFWVKAKGFRLGKFAGKDAENADTELLYIPSKHHSADLGPGEKAFKRVAVVEDFFDIIYNVHVEMDGRGGKHAGQKRTYRAIAQTYAFLPREAVTKFLMSCSDCQKRMHLTMDSAYSSPPVDNKPSCAAAASQLAAVTRDPPPHPLLPSPRSSAGAGANDRHQPFGTTLQITDYSLPITVSYLNYLKQKKKNKAKAAAAAAAAVAAMQQQPSKRQRCQEEEEDDDEEGGCGGGEDAEEEVGASSPPRSLQQPPSAVEESELRNAGCYRDDDEEARIDGISTYQAMADSSSASPQLSPGDSGQVVFSADQSSNYEPMAVDKDEPKTTDNQENSPLDLSSSNSTEHDSSANYDDDINVEESMELSYDVRENFPPPSELCQLPVDVKVSEDEDKGDYVTRKDTTGRSDLSGNIKGRRFFDRTASPEEGYKVNFSRSASGVQVKSVSLSPCHSVQSTQNNDRSFSRAHFFQPLIARAPLLTDTSGHSDSRRFGGGLFEQRPSGIREEYKSLCEVVARATVPLHPPHSSAPISLMALPGGRPAAFHSGGSGSSGTAFLPCFPLNYGPIAKTNILSKKPDNFFQTDLAPSMAMTTRDNSPFKLGKAFQFSELVTIRQIIAGYRDSAAFLRRSADELELLLLQQK